MIPQTAEYWIEKLKLEKHPEGGFYKETYRSKLELSAGAFEKYEGKRNMFTCIYYLLKGHDFSAFHRIRSEEVWHFYNGSPMTIYIIGQDGNLEKRLLGSNPDNMEDFQLCIPANTWFAAKVNNPVLYSLVGCTVAPGFDFKDFEMASKDILTGEYPQLRNTIEELCRES